MRKLTHPVDTNPLAKVSESQRQLAQTIEEFARRLAAEKSPAAQSAREAAVNARAAANQLEVGKSTSANESTVRASQLLREVASMHVPVAKAATDLAVREDDIRSTMGASPPAPAVVAAQQQARGKVLANRAGELARHFLESARANASRESIQSALDQSAHELSATEKLIVDATEKAAEGMPDESSKLHGEAIRQIATSMGKVAALMPKPSTFMEAEPTTLKAATILEQAESTMRRVLEQLNVKADGKAPEKAMRIAADSLSAAAKARMGADGEVVSQEEGTISRRPSGDPGRCSSRDR